MTHRKRIQSVLWMIPLAIAAIWFLPTPWMGALMALLLLAGLHEWCALAGLDRTQAKWSYLAANGALVAFIAWTDGPAHHNLMTAMFVGGAFWVLVPLWLWKFDFARESCNRNRFAKLLVGMLACVPAWAALVWIHGSDGGPAWTLFAIGLVAAADSGAYIFGVNFGKHKLAPNISPGKSWEGFWGGLGVTLALALVCMPLFDAPWSDFWRYGLLGLLTGVFSVFGDLFESLMKRHACIKDSSALIPGHGGLLDRLDSIVSGLVVFALVKYGLAL
jgi:phosphatidate cytidylyltransferase